MNASIEDAAHCFNARGSSLLNFPVILIDNKTNLRSPSVALELFLKQKKKPTQKANNNFNENHLCC
jgi:hypothetical protein